MSFHLPRSIRPARSFCWLSLVLLALTGCTLGGCAANTAELDAEGVRTQAQPSSAARMDNDGTQTANFQGVSPTQVKQDASGSWITTPGIGGVLTFDRDSGVLHTWSPGDIEVHGVTVTPEPNPGEPSFQAERIVSNKSAVASVYADQFRAAMTAIEGMTQIEAEGRVRQLEQARLITSDVAQVLLESVIPQLP